MHPKLEFIRQELARQCGELKELIGQFAISTNDSAKHNLAKAINKKSLDIVGELTLQTVKIDPKDLGDDLVAMQSLFDDSSKVRQEISDQVGMTLEPFRKQIAKNLAQSELNFQNVLEEPERVYQQAKEKLRRLGG